MVDLVDLCALDLLICRVSIQSSLFYGDLDELDPAILIQLYTAACGIIEKMSEMDQKWHLMSYCSMYMFFGLLMATSTLLRILQGDLFTRFSISTNENGGETFFLAVTLMKGMSIENDDLPARCSSILSQLWTSRRIFMHPDGTKSPELRVRSRLAMGPVFDCLWWWREEFGGQPNTYPSSRVSTKSSHRASQREFQHLSAVLFAGTWHPSDCRC